jgi:hypothetical protein
MFKDTLVADGDDFGILWFFVMVFRSGVLVT